jgi:uncharacterized protein (DUF427 family)
MPTEQRRETADKRLRAMVGGHYVFDTTAPLLVWDRPHYPTYHVAEADVLAAVDEHPDGTVDVTIGGRTVHRAGRTGEPGYLTFRWGAFEHWFEEDDEVFVHPRDPYKRVDILHSSRHARIEVDGVTVADSLRPTLLLETSLPTRFYLPKTDVRMDLLAPSTTVSHCPYKGQAEYWSVTAAGTAGIDLAWSYRSPVRESAPIAGLVAFYDERVDTWIDGERRTRPESPFS